MFDLPWRPRAGAMEYRRMSGMVGPTFALNHPVAENGTRSLQKNKE
jgi:hypothetical protein